MLIQAEESPCEIQGSMWNDGQFERFNPVRRLVIIRRVQEVLIPSHTHTHNWRGLAKGTPPSGGSPFRFPVAPIFRHYGVDARKLSCRVLEDGTFL